jgi:hypothetical protein
LGLLHELPENVERLAQPSQEIGFHLLSGVTANSQVLPPLWQLAVNVQTEVTTYEVQSVRTKTFRIVFFINGCPLWIISYYPSSRMESQATRSLTVAHRGFGG